MMVSARRSMRGRDGHFGVAPGDQDREDSSERRGVDGDGADEHESAPDILGDDATRVGGLEMHPLQRHVVGNALRESCRERRQVIPRSVYRRDSTDHRGRAASEPSREVEPPRLIVDTGSVFVRRHKLRILSDRL